jgi:hypothetical protein
LFQLWQTRKLNAVLLLETEFVTRKVPIRISDLANAAKGCVEIKQLEETLTRPLRNRDEEISMLYVLKTRFQPSRRQLNQSQRKEKGESNANQTNTDTRSVPERRESCA